MGNHYSHAVESNAAERSPQKLLRSSVTVLIGVDDEAKRALEEIGIENVHDLATSPIFDVARAVYETASSGDPSGGAEQTTAIAAANRQTDGDLAKLAAAGIEELEGIDQSAAETLRSALGVASVQDLAKWPPYKGARDILGALTGIDAETDRGVPEELVPTARKYATEQSFYTKVYLDQRIEELDAPDTGFDPLDREDIIEDITEHGMTIDWSPQWNRIAGALDDINADEESEAEDEEEEEEPSEEAITGLSTMTRSANLLSTAGDRRIDITTADPEIGGFRQPAVGGVLQFTQEWVPQGLSLGQLLHSTTLAPGESTKVAVIDWSRRTRGERQEAESQRERTEARMVQNRSMTEVQNGVTSEVQSGRSMVSSESKSKQHGHTSNRGVFGTGGSHTWGEAKTSSTTETVSTSRGRREVHAAMTQKIRNSTQQHASSSRTRRASVVRETEQEESEEVRTRIITNHNHMHALSVHYYEVVQIFRVEVGPEDAQPVLFVPFKPIDFESNEDIVHQYRNALADAALSPEVRDLVEGVTGYMWLEPDPNFSTMITGEHSIQEMGGEWSPEGNSRWRIPTNLRITGVETGMSVPTFGIDFEIKRFGGKSDVSIPYADPAGDTTDEWRKDVDPPIPIEEVEAVAVNLTWEEDDPDSGNNLRPGIILEGPDGNTTNIQLTGEAPAGIDQIRFLEGRQRSAKGELTTRLNRNKLHYSQAIWESLDPQTAAMLLGGFQIDGRAAVEYVNTTPETTHGNYVAFPLALPESLEDAPDETYAKLVAWWDRWTDRNYDPDLRERDLVPLPSGGVHGESILGRANGAEKLDVTRFWDWQESPIPQQAPQISPVQTESRATGEDLRPSGFDQPIVQLQQPQQLPDPTGVGAVLDTLGQSGIFRDMSGMQAAADLAATTSKITGQGARHATDAAVETFKTGAKAQNQALSTVADTITSLAGGGEFSAANAGNSSFGAALNEAKKMDAASGAVGSQAGGSGGGDGGGSPGGGGGSGGGSGGSRVDGRGGGGGGGGGGGSGDGGSLARDMLSERAMPNRASEGGSVSDARGSSGTGSGGSGGGGSGSSSQSGRSYIISGPGVSAERRAFNPASDDLSGTIDLSVRVPNLPTGGTIRWSVPSSAQGDIALGNDPNNLQSEVDGAQVTVMGLTPGLTELSVSVLDDQDTVIESHKYELSVPAFVEVGETGSFGTALSNYNLASVHDEIIRQVRAAAEHALQNANVRIVWTMAPFNHSLPSQFQSGGPADDNVTTATLDDDTNLNAYAQTSPGPSGAIGPNAHDEQIDIWVKKFESAGTGTANETLDEATKGALQATLNADMSSPDIQGVAAKLFGRLIGESLAHEIGHALIGTPYGTAGGTNQAHNGGGGGLMRPGYDRSLLDRTGFSATMSSPDPSTLTDQGTAVINIPQGAGATVIDNNFPVPPTFS